MTQHWLLIRYYKDFYDIPRAFVVQRAASNFFSIAPSVTRWTMTEMTTPSTGLAMSCASEST